MDERTKELIAVGAFVTANCHPCIKYHLAKAREADAECSEIREAVAMGKMVRKGAANEMDKFLAELIGGAPVADEDQKGCGCK